MPRNHFLAVPVALVLCGFAQQATTQTSVLLPDRHFGAIRDESSGELPLIDFHAIETRFTGFSPSKGGDQIAEYLAARMREYGLSDVRIEGFPSTGSCSADSARART